MLAHACFGISGSVLYTPATAVVGHWFLKRRGTATGIVSTGVGLGGVIYPIMLNRLFDTWSEFFAERRG
jgi:MFS family permease